MTEATNFSASQSSAARPIFRATSASCSSAAGARPIAFVIGCNPSTANWLKDDTT